MYQESATRRALLAEFALPGQAGIYVIGSFDRKTSLYYQQVRALNLVWLLGERPGPVCVIGGGIAGVTAAAALLTRGQAGVTLLERGPELLALQRHNHTRRIHPHLYAWPAAGSEQPEAGLPLLDWRAGLSADVAAAWLAELETLSRRRPADVQIMTGAGAEALEPDAAGWRVRWRQGDQVQAQVFAQVILALGVGIERTVEGLPLHSYWEDDNLHGNGGRLLVSGCGEGGLLEVLRLRLRDFDPEREAAALAGAQDLKRELLAWEASLPAQADPAAWLTARYLSLELPELDARLSAQLIPGLSLSLHGPHPDSPLNPQATMLNRLLVSRLLRLGDLDYLGGKKLLSAARTPTGWRAGFSDGSAADYDAILIRHGASSALKRQFGSLWEQALAFRATGTDPRLLQPLWPADFYPLPA